MSVPKLKLLNVMPSRATDLEGLKKDYNDLIQKLVMHFGVASFESGKFKPATDTDIQYVQCTDPGPTVANTQVEVDLSSDGAPDHSIGAIIRWVFTNASGATSTLSMRSTSAGTFNAVDQVLTGDRRSVFFPIYFVSGSKSTFLTSTQNLTESNIRVVSWIF